MARGAAAQVPGHLLCPPLGFPGVLVSCVSLIHEHRLGSLNNTNVSFIACRSDVCTKPHGARIKVSAVPRSFWKLEGGICVLLIWVVGGIHLLGVGGLTSRFLAGCQQGLWAPHSACGTVSQSQQRGATASHLASRCPFFRAAAGRSSPLKRNCF